MPSPQPESAGKNKTQQESAANSKSQRKAKKQQQQREEVPSRGRTPPRDVPQPAEAPEPPEIAEIPEAEEDYTERTQRLYPRDVTKSPPTPSRYNPTSPLLAPYNPTSRPIPVGSSPPQYNYGLPSHSPPMVGSRPLSHPTQFPNFGARLPSSPSPARDRRASMYNYGNVTPFGSNPPLPHMPQAHFYGTPEIDFELPNGPTAGKLKAGDRGYFCGYDTLDKSGHGASLQAQTVLLVGSEGSLEVWKVERRNMEPVGLLSGLRGGVIAAKILPWTEHHDSLAAKRPLVAVVIHGPVLPEQHERPQEDDLLSSLGGMDLDSKSDKQAARPISGALQIYYQTTVEIHSLSTAEHIATLYKSEPVFAPGPIDSPLFQAPAPVGEVRLDANGRHVVVASGTSGEIFVFAPYVPSKPDHPEVFRLIGKFWTSVQLRERGATSSASSATDTDARDSEPAGHFGVPVFSLSQRWLAITPPAHSALSSIDGSPLTAKSYPKPPGLYIKLAPPQPSSTCIVDAPDANLLWESMARGGTQAVLKSAKWAANQSMQYWKTYWNKQPNVNGQAAANLVEAALGDPQMQQYFPPTHGHSQATTSASNEPAVVSIIDLHKLELAEETRNRNALNPVASFTPPHGCSILSFSTSGFHLMTVSRKGDQHLVWDLKRMRHGASGSASSKRSQRPSVRQVARFTRMTESKVVDITWSAPNGNRVAVLTEKGTVHMYPMPSTAYQWPPSRRRDRTAEIGKPIEESAAESMSKRSSLGTVSSAVQGFGTSSLSFINSVRNRRPSGGSALPTLSNLSMAPAVAAKSGKAAASSLTKSLGTAANNYRHAGDNKLSLPSIEQGVYPGSVLWMTGKERGSIALVAGGLVRTVDVRMGSASGRAKGGAAGASITKGTPREFRLPHIPDWRLSPAAQAALFAQDQDIAPTHFQSTASARSYYTLRHPPRHLHQQSPTLRTASYPLSHAEINTNPPYQPFHTDRRVALYAYVDPEEPWNDNPHHIDDADPWLFGTAIAATPLSITQHHNAHMHDNGEDDDLIGLGEDDAGGMTGQSMQDTMIKKAKCGEGVEQVIVTTRRKKGRKGVGMGGGDGAEEGDGFFEDDCEVLDFAEDRV